MIAPLATRLDPHRAPPPTPRGGGNWAVVAAAAAALVVGQGPVNVFAASVFMKPLAAGLGLGRGTIASAIGLSSLCTALCTPLFGALLDRWGVRPLLALSICLFAAAVACLSLLQPSVPLVLGLFALCGVAAVGNNPTAYSKVICGWFDRRRGLALGLALAGVGLGTALLPQLSGWLLARLGWRGAYLALAGCILVLAALPAALFVRERPALTVPAGAPALPGLTLREAARDRRYWALGAAFLLGAMTINGTLVHIVPLLTDRGIPPAEAVSALSVAGLALIGGRVLAGALMDRLFAPYVAAVFLAVPIAGLVLLGLGLGGNLVALAGAACLGLGIGAEIDLMSFILARYFGMRAFGTLHGLLFAATLLGNAAGASLLGWSFQSLHGYGPGFALFGALLAMACALLCTLGPYRYGVTVEIPA